MKRIVTWLGRNADGLLALVLAAVVGVVTWLDLVSTEDTNSATLLVLAVLAIALLRERARQRSVEQGLQTLSETVEHNHAEVGGKLSGIGSSLDDNKVAVENLSMVRTLIGREITQALSEARKDTDRWLFKGGTGTYMRAVTLPECVKNARQAHRVLRVRMEIIDPTNVDACDRYGRLRRALSSRSNDDELWTLDRVRKESYATILAGLWWRRQYELLDVDIGLSAGITTLRWDLSASRLIITLEDPLSPGLVIEQDRAFFRRLDLELKTSLEQAKEVPLERTLDIALSSPPTVEEIRQFFTCLELDLPDSYADSDVQDIVRKVVSPTNPYEDDLSRQDV